MPGSTFGDVFKLMTFGESHGPGLGVVIDGVPPLLELTEADIQVDLDRRRPGQSHIVTPRNEADTVEILSGVFEGKATGTPLAMVVFNEDQRSKDYSKIRDVFRPGHADYTYWQKYGIRDYRGGGRSSARETAVRVAAAAIAKKWLREKYGVVIRGYMSQLGTIEIPFKQWDMVNQNPFFVADTDSVPDLEKFMDKLRKSGDSVGAKINVVAQGVPVGWGEPVYDRLDAEIAYSMMSINAVKGVEIGSGFASIAQRGTQHSDEITPEGFLSNNAGGVLGGISTGQDITVNIAIKPTSSIRLDRRSMDKTGKPLVVTTHGRHDPCVGIRATPIAEAMLALVLMDHALRHRAQNADVACLTPKIPSKIIKKRFASLKSKVRLKSAENPEPDEA